MTDLTLQQRVAARWWCVTTEDDCWGHPPGTTQPERYALYDGHEDDPPIAIFDWREDAEMVAAALNAFATQPEQNTRGES